MKFKITPIGFIQSSFKEKFATPRQPGLVTAASGTITLVPPFNHPDTVLGLETCSHIWLQFMFHQCLEQGWKNKVRPPRLGGNKKMGVFATRATHRPNGIGLSVVKLDGISTAHNQVTLHISELDLIEGTPIIDIKPYIPYSDALPHAHYPFAQHAPILTPVSFSAQAQQALSAQSNAEQLKQLIEQVLSQDPKPAFHKHDESRIYGAQLEDVNVTWCYRENEQGGYIEVANIE